MRAPRTPAQCRHETADPGEHPAMDRNGRAEGKGPRPPQSRNPDRGYEPFVDELRAELDLLLRKQAAILESRSFGSASDTELIEYEVRQEIVHEICNQLANSVEAQQSILRCGRLSPREKYAGASAKHHGSNWSGGQRYRNRKCSSDEFCRRSRAQSQKECRSCELPVPDDYIQREVPNLLKYKNHSSVSNDPLKYLGKFPRIKRIKRLITDFSHDHQEVINVLNKKRSLLIENDKDIVEHHKHIKTSRTRNSPWTCINSWKFDLSDGISPFKFQKFNCSNYTHSFFNFLGSSRIVNPVLVATNIITSFWKNSSISRLCANKRAFLFPTKTELMRLNSVFQTRLVYMFLNKHGNGKHQIYPPDFPCTKKLRIQPPLPEVASPSRDASFRFNFI